MVDESQIAQIALEAAIAVASVATRRPSRQRYSANFQKVVFQPLHVRTSHSLTGRDLELVFDYSEGCKSYNFPWATIRGVVQGIYYTAYNAFNIQFENVAVNEQSLSAP